MNVGGTFSLLLQKYGRQVTLFAEGAQEGVSGRAFLQPVREQKQQPRQVLPTELGEIQEGGFLYLGDPDLSLEGLDRGTVRCDGMDYEIRTAQMIFIGDRKSHWRALLTGKGGEAL